MPLFPFGFAPPHQGRAATALAVSLAALLGSGIAHADPTLPGSENAMTLRAAIRVALDRNAALASRRKSVDIAESDERAAAARLGPVLRAEVNAFVWNSDNRYAFDTSGFQGLFAQLGAPPGVTVPPMTVTVREQVTAKTTIMAIQPLTRLWQIVRGREARRELVRASRFDAVAAERDLELQVARAFFGHVSAQQMLGTVEEAEKTIKAYEKQTSDYVAAGLVEHDALLTVQVQREELAKTRLAVEKAIALTRAQLNMLMGRSLDADLELACTTCGRGNATTPPLEELQSRALLERPELASGRAQRNAAEAAAEAARGKLAPDVNLVGAYVNNAGMGDLMLKNEAFAGLMLSWNAWEWGATTHEVRAAELRREQADLALRSAEDGLRLHVHQRSLELREAQRQRVVAEAALALAREALRLEENRFRVHATEAADLVRAQTTAVKAAHDVTLATMQIELARRELAIASGQDLLASLDADPQETAR